jgi:4-hydroxybenzoate polyprenyltransferase
MPGIKQSVALFVELVKFEHTVFALPFAYMGALLAGRGEVAPWEWFWITVCMVAARTAGMALNRYVDRHIDARNPRTAGRTLPRGAMSEDSVRWLAVASMAVLPLAAYQLQPICAQLSPLAIMLLLAYSYLKRYTRYAHLGVGLVLACAPVGAWLAVRGHLDWPILLLAGAVLCWVSGFDILYACQDIEFDRQEGLHSVPQALGAGPALQMARALHSGTFALLILLALALKLGVWYLGGVGVIGALLVYEHMIVSEQDMSRLNQAFFNVNGYISVILYLSTLANYRL